MCVKLRDQEGGGYSRLWHRLILEAGENIMGHIGESGFEDVLSRKSHDQFAF